MNTLKQRMYHLTMYNISEIQKGIQSYHAGMEYARKFWDTPSFQQWITNDKTVIILNGGTSNNLAEVTGWEMTDTAGSMERALQELKDNDIRCASFNEPDLNGATSAIAFLCDETVWDKETYSDEPILKAWKAQKATCAEYDQPYEKYLRGELKNLYGERVAFLRLWLRQFRLA